jgi:hypothetical protein
MIFLFILFQFAIPITYITEPHSTFIPPSSKLTYLVNVTHITSSNPRIRALTAKHDISLGLQSFAWYSRHILASCYWQPCSLLNVLKQIKMASKNVTTVDTRAELAELVKRKAEIAVWLWCSHAVNVVLWNTVMICNQHTILKCSFVILGLR